MQRPQDGIRNQDIVAARQQSYQLCHRALKKWQKKKNS